MSKIIILGSGAAPGVPCLCKGFGDCDPKNPKNYRLRSATYMELSGVKFLIDTGPDLRTQLLNNDIHSLDAVFYTHTHADHLHGIDDLREINRVSGTALDIYASKNCMEEICTRFGYLIVKDIKNIQPYYFPALLPHAFDFGESFMVKDLKVTPIELLGHSVEVSGYVFNDGEVVFISDFRSIPEESLKHIKKQPEVLIMPLTAPQGVSFHASLDVVAHYAELIKPKRTIINHMAVESDYEQVKAACKDMIGHLEPAYDGMNIIF